MIDFGKGVEKLNRYSGSEVKTTVLFENDLYMLKYPDPVRKKKNRLSYMNNQYSEHIGSLIYKSCGFDVQDTALGYYTDFKGQKKVVVGCRDFTQDGSVLHEFTKLSSQIEVDGKQGATIESVYEIIKQSCFIIDKDAIINKFWDMFVIDTLIGNTDRHFDNWGLLEKDGVITFAPVYDCGSSLAALIDDASMEGMLANASVFKNEEFNLKSCYYINGKRIFYHEIYKAPPLDLSNATRRMVPKINIEKINYIIENVPTMSNIRKEYLKKAIGIRYSQILIPAYNHT